MKQKQLLTAFLLLMTNIVFSQVSISGGGSMLNPFGVKKSFYGLHLGGELPQNNQVTFFWTCELFFS